MGFFKQCLQLILQTYFASVDTLCALVFATGTVRHRARSSRLAPAIRAVSPNVLRLESLSYARAARDWTRLAPDAVFRTSGLHLPDSDTSASNTAPALPKRASNIDDSITTSSTCCSISHSDSTRNCSGLLPY